MASADSSNWWATTEEGGYVRNVAIVRTRDDLLTVKFTSRDWKLLFGPHVPCGLGLLELLGFFSEEDISVGRLSLLEAASDVLETLKGDRDLLQYDYQYNIERYAASPRQRDSGPHSGFAIGGRQKHIVTEPGHCYVCELGERPDGRVGWVNIADVRAQQCIETDDAGAIKIYRRKRGLTWLEELPALIEFLAESTEAEVTVHNEHRR
jgi:hypothetical protein